MRNSILRILLALCLVGVLCGCKKEPKNADVSGDWKMESYQGVSASAGDIDVYLSFDKEGGFEIFQRFGAGHFSRYEGLYTVLKQTLSGSYLDGSLWKGDYTVEMEDNILTLTSVSNPEDFSTFTRSSIPASVRQDAEDYS